MNPFTPLTTPVEFDRALQESRDRPVVIFKHSPRCSISAHALGDFRQYIEGVPPSDPPLFIVVDVVGARFVSDEIARRTGIRHESPQALVLRDGRVVWAGSHWDITDEALDRALDEARRN
ncbi:bacillithiol system redox-active protein YtxJ [bacterium]|nr:bacillithiol system redox-active protein YtxJ [bacterium]